MSIKKLDNCVNYSFPSYVKLLVNNEKFSDVSFLIGEKHELIYAHKMVLASGSPVMEKMFFGDLAEKDYPIKIPDLTPNGFLNMLKYMYGYDIDFNFSILYEVYMAADKYLVYNLTDAIFEYIKSNLNEFNCCLIYDQLVKINKDTDALDLVQNLIKVKTKEAFSSKFFKEISKECLIDILEMNFLIIDEIDILKNCLNWIEAELLRTNQLLTIENKRAIFKVIRPFIRFSKITIQQLIDFKEINSLLNSEDIGNLFLYLTDNEKLIPFECKTLRKMIKSHIVCTKGGNYHTNYITSSFSILLNTNQELIILNIGTLLGKSVNNLVLIIYNDKDEIINIKQVKILSSNGLWNFKLSNFIVTPNTGYKFFFKFDEFYFTKDHLNDVFKLEANDNGSKIILNLQFENCHCIEKISFCTLN